MQRESELLDATVVALVDALARGEVSARAVCEAAIARIEERNGPINAVVVRDFARAREAADRADDALRAGERRPLLGVPMTVKESFDVAGLPTTWGHAAHRDSRVSTDAVAVARLKRAGAVILGKTNVALDLADWQTDNEAYGRTQNPLDLTRTPGGSSGGSAAALAGGMVPLELGSDIGGSIRVPAHFCGVFGHKPSYGLVPTRGHEPPGFDGAPPELGTVGPMARSAGDLALALDVLAGPDEHEAVGYRLALPEPTIPSLAGLRVCVLDAHPRCATAASIRAALGGLADDLARAGAHVLRASPHLPDLALQHAVYVPMFLTITSGGTWTGSEGPLSAKSWFALLDARARLRRAWSRCFREVDVLIAPTFGSLAFAHLGPAAPGTRTLRIDGVDTRYGDQFAWPGVATLPGLPATLVPIARTPEGLPIGAQVIGAYLHDRTTLRVAALVEQLRRL